MSFSRFYFGSWGMAADGFITDVTCRVYIIGATMFSNLLFFSAQVNNYPSEITYAPPPTLYQTLDQTSTRTVALTSTLQASRFTAIRRNISSFTLNYAPIVVVCGNG